MKIYKYPAEGSVRLPIGAQVVHFGTQRCEKYIWVMFNEPKETPTAFELRTFRIVGTGQTFSDNSRYVGTIHEPPFIWHLIEETHNG